MLRNEQEYRSHPALAQSTVKYILRGVNEYKNKTKEMSDFIYRKGIAIGNVVDALLTDKNKVDLINVIPSEQPSGKVLEVIKFMLKGNSFDESYELANIRSKNKAYSKQSIKDTIDNSKYYYAMLNMLNHSKITIMEEDYNTALKVYDSLKHHEFTRWYCMDEYGGDVRAYTQYPIVFNYMGREMKALLDKVIINDYLREVQPIDFKTTEFNTTNFRKPFKQMGYDIQAYWYTQACKIHFRNYKILPFAFVVESTTNQGCPLVYEVSKSTLKETKKKVHDALDLYSWHEQNGFKYDKHIVENNGVILI